LIVSALQQEHLYFLQNIGCLATTHRLLGYINAAGPLTGDRPRRVYEFGGAGAPLTTSRRRATTQPPRA